MTGEAHLSAWHGDGRRRHSSTGRSARDRDSLHLAAECRRHHPRLHKDDRGSGQ
jgi:hypothetical protein